MSDIKTQPKFKLRFGDYKVTLEKGDGRQIQLEISIGCAGGWTYTDNLGNRYVPYVEDVSPTRQMVETWEPLCYRVIALDGTAWYLIDLEDLED
jgi:hypothetical protein